MHWLPVLAFALAFALAGCGARVPGVGKVGQKLEYKGYALTVLSVDTADDYSGARAARAGNKLVAVEVLVESGVARGAHWDADHSRLATRDGTLHKARSTGKAPVAQPVQDIPKGASVRGWVTYEIPKGIRVARFEFELPSAFDNVILKVELDV
jgi:hypothetical protein